MTKELENAFNIAIKYGFCDNCRRELDENNCKDYGCYQNSVKLIREALEKQSQSCGTCIYNDGTAWCNFHDMNCNIMKSCGFWKDK